MRYFMKVEQLKSTGGNVSIISVDISKSKFYEAYETARKRDYNMQVYAGVDYYSFVFNAGLVKFSFWAVEL